MSWHLKAFDDLDSKTLYQILKARCDVFVVEQTCPYPELDGLDPACYHLYLEEAGDILAYLRILPPGLSFEEASLGRVLVTPSARGQGYARSLLEKGLDFVQTELKQDQVKIGAQTYLESFYASLGFAPVSAPYLEDGIEHIDMVVTFTDSQQ